MGTIIWIFFGMGILFTVLTVFYFIVVIILACLRDGFYYGAWDFATMETGGASMIVGIIGILIVATAAFLIEKIFKIEKMFKIKPKP